MQEFTINDQSFQGYISYPKSQSGPGVLVFHAWWGLTPFFTQVCDNLANRGFVALAPDLFHGETAHTIDQAKELRSQTDRKKAKIEARVAIDYLGTHTAGSNSMLASIGFSYGCAFALEAARLRPNLVNSVSLFYGTGGGKFDKTQAVFQGHFAENDEWGANPKKAQSLEKRINDANQTAQFYVYPSTTHWFFEPDNEAYNKEAAELAWQRTVTFLTERLIDLESN
ncbi:MAG: dienelactone hydrolase family protein [Chloroflexota bacterium]